MPGKISKIGNISKRTVKRLKFNGNCPVCFMQRAQIIRSLSLNTALSTRQQQNNIDQVPREKRVAQEFSMQPNYTVTMKERGKHS